MDGSKSSQLRGVIERFVTQLAAETEAAKSSAPLLNYLAFCSRFRDYSIHNCCLIYSQKPDATRVAGFRAWHKMGRFVRKGERGIVILAPVLARRHSEETMEEETNKNPVRFRSVYVFDESQTEGLALPESPILTGADCADDLALSLVLFADSSGIKVKSETISGSACGVSRGGEIVIDESLAGADYFSVLAHEVAHELLNHRARHDELDKRSREVEAETVAFTVSRHFNVPCTAPAYLALHGADAADITARLENIVGVTQQIIRNVEANFDSLNQQASNQ